MKLRISIPTFHKSMTIGTKLIRGFLVLLFLGASPHAWSGSIDGYNYIPSSSGKAAAYSYQNTSFSEKYISSGSGTITTGAGGSTEYYTSGTDGITLTDEGAGFLGYPVATPEYLMLPATSNPGDTFTTTGSITFQDGTTCPYNETTQITGLEPVSVPAGFFNNALKVIMTVTCSYIEPGVGPETETFTGTLWFGLGIGLLKETMNATVTVNGSTVPLETNEIDLLFSVIAGSSDSKDDCWGAVNGCDQNAADPINIRTGNSIKSQVDYRSPDGLLDLQRIYNSSVVQARTVGAGWRHNYDRQLLFVPQAAPRLAVLMRAEGAVLAFHEPAGSPGASGKWLGDIDVNGQLTPTYSGGNTTPTGWVYVTDRNEVETYDVNGNLTAISRADGKSVALVYTTVNSSTALSTVTDNNGHKLSYQYDSEGRVSQVTEPTGKAVVYGYDGAQNLSTVKHQDGSVRTYNYNEQSRTGNTNLPNALTSILDENNNVYVSWEFNSLGQATNSQLAGSIQNTTISYATATSSTVTDGEGTVDTIAFNTQFGVTKPTSMSSASNSAAPIGDAARTYDANGNISSRTDFNHNKSCYAFDQTRNLALVSVSAFPSSTVCPSSLSSYSIPTPAAGADITQRKVSTTWHPDWRLPVERAEPNKLTTWVYNGQIYQGAAVTCAPLNALANGKPIAVVCKRIEQATSDSTGTLGFNASVVGTAREWDMTYSATGQLLTLNGPRTDGTDVTTYTYFSCTTGSQCGHVQTITNALHQVVTFNTYNGAGNPLTLSDANSVPTTLTYDARGRLTSREIGAETLTLSYYPNGRLKRKTLPDGSYLVHLYNTAGLLDEVDDSFGNRFVYSIDKMGNQSGLTEYNASGTIVRSHTRTFNALNRLTTDVNAAGTAAVTTTYGYDAQGNQTSADAPLSRTTGIQYDALNRRSQLTDPTSGTSYMVYDASNRLLSVKDPRSLMTSYVYDGYGDLLTQSSPDTGNVTKTYDSAGNLKTSTDQRGAVATYTYDALNRKTQESYTDQTINFTYDSGTDGKGRLTSAADANHSMSWTYDTHGRVTGKGQTVASITKSVGYTYTNGDLTSFVTPSGQTITYGYTHHRISSIKVGTTTLLNSVTYDPAGPSTGWTWGNSSTVSRTFDEDGNPRQIVTAGATNGYTVDSASRITSLSDSGLASNTWSFSSFDNLDRVKAASSTAKSRGYTYDASGNRLTTTGTTASTESIATASNRLSSTSGGLVRTYGYDAAGNTTSYTGETFTFNQRGRMSTATSSSATSYVYNALGQLIKKSGNGGTTLFMYDEAGRLLGEYSSTGALIEETIWMGNLPVATLLPSGSTVAIYYVHSDHLGTPRKITRPSDNGLMWRWDPDTFGSVAPNSNPAGLGTFTYNLRFPGQYSLSESGLYYNVHRTYDPQMGRYLESDPVGLGGGINTYAYAGSNPILRSDRYGLTWDDTSQHSQLQWYDGSGPWQPQLAAYDETQAQPSSSGISPLTLAAMGATSVLVPIAGEAFDAAMLGEGAFSAAESVADAAVSEGTTLYRVFGGESSGYGSYWTTVKPADVGDFRLTAGLPTGNTGQFLAEGTLIDATEVTLGQADPIPGSGLGGGLPEVIVPNPASQICFTLVCGLNPPF